LKCNPYQAGSTARLQRLNAIKHLRLSLPRGAGLRFRYFFVPLVARSSNQHAAMQRLGKPVHHGYANRAQK
jgi:hypothetical protein